jgi:histidyl-tRNA synthetase
VIVGPDEVEARVCNLRDLATREETRRVPWSDLVAVVKRVLGT